jgi:hypothetical protein
MKSLVSRLGALISLWLALVAACAFAQTQTPTFEPSIGQPGKDVVWVPTPDALVERMLDVAHVTPQDYLIDLGSGDGRTVIAAAKRGARALGIEYNPDMVELSKRNAEAAHVSSKATFVKADLFETDFSKATVITMFLLPSINMQLRPKLLALKPGTRIVSNTFTMEDWEADETATIPNCEGYCTAFFWTVPANVEGAWRTAQGSLSLTQKFQVVNGAFGDTRITNAKLRGDRLSFSAGSAQYSGRVHGNTIEGTMTSGGKTSNWRATR